MHRWEWSFLVNLFPLFVATRVVALVSKLVNGSVGRSVGSFEAFGLVLLDQITWEGEESKRKSDEKGVETHFDLLEPYLDLLLVTSLIS